MSEHERFGAIGMLQAWVRVSDVTWYYTCHPLTVQRLRDRYQATEQWNIDAGLVNQNDELPLRWQLTSSISTILASTISVPTGYRQCQTNSKVPRVICIQIFNKIFLYKYFKSRPISRLIQIVTIDRELLIDPPPTRGNCVHYDFLKLHYIWSKMTYVSPLAVGALLCYSLVNYVTI